MGLVISSGDLDNVLLTVRSVLMRKRNLRGIRTTRTLCVQAILALALVIIPGSTATAEERPAESAGEKIQPSPESSGDGLTRDEKERIRRNKAADQFMKDQAKGKGKAPAFPVSKPANKASLPNLCPKAKPLLMTTRASSATPRST